MSLYSGGRDKEPNPKKLQSQKIAPGMRWRRHRESVRRTRSGLAWSRCRPAKGRRRNGCSRRWERGLLGDGASSRQEEDRVFRAACWKIGAEFQPVAGKAVETEDADPLVNDNFWIVDNRVRCEQAVRYKGDEGAQQCLYFLPDPQGQRSFLPTLGAAARGVATIRAPMLFIVG